MPDVLIPIDATAPDQRFRVRLGSEQVEIELHWSALNSLWYISVGGVVSWRAVVPEEPLALVAGGVLVALPERGASDTIGRNAWGTSHELFWADFYQ